MSCLSVVSYNLGHTSVWSHQHYRAFCDKCETKCWGARYMCLECIDNATEDAQSGETVDFCRLECTQCEIHPYPSAQATKHTPDHNILKASTFINLRRDQVRVHRAGNHAIAVMRQNISSQTTCGVCQDVVALPCWFCVDCLQNGASLLSSHIHSRSIQRHPRRGSSAIPLRQL